MLACALGSAILAVIVDYFAAAIAAVSLLILAIRSFQRFLTSAAVKSKSFLPASLITVLPMTSHKFRCLLPWDCRS